MGLLKVLGAVLIVAWLVMWLAVKITSGVIHLLLLVGLVMLIVGFFRRA